MLGAPGPAVLGGRPGPTFGDHSSPAGRGGPARPGTSRHTDGKAGGGTERIIRTLQRISDDLEGLLLSVQEVLAHFL